MQRLNELIEHIQNRLSFEYNDVTERTQYAWWILQSLTGLNKVHLIEQVNVDLTEDQQQKLQEWLYKLVDQHMPLQYLLGSVPFNGVEILIKPPVLIPRPETEEWTIKLCDQLQNIYNKKITILDLCTGSGCIAIALAKAFDQAIIYATDIADEAIACTKENITHNKLNNVIVIQSDLFEKIPDNTKFDVIVANPPYIAPDEWTLLDPSVTQWEDQRALVASHEGLGIIEHIIKQAPAYLKPNADLAEHNIPQLVIEIGHTQAHKVKQIMIQMGYCDITINKDLEGKDRTVSARVVPCGYLNQ